MSDIVMPRLSDSMEEGTVVRWLKKLGDTVVRGDPIVEIETDKATITYEADVEGVLEQIIVGEGQTVPIGTRIAHLNESGSAPRPQSLPGATALSLPAEPSGSPAPLPMPQDSSDFEFADQNVEQPGYQQDPEPALRPPQQPEPQQPEQQQTEDFASYEPEPPATDEHESLDLESQGRVKASPIARRLARKLGVDLEGIEGTGPGGRIVKEDVEAAANETSQHTGQGPAIHAPATDEPIFTPYQPESDLVEPHSPAPLPNDFGSTGAQEQYTGEQPAAPQYQPPPPMPMPPQQYPQQPQQPYPQAPPPQGYPPQPYPPQPYPPQQQQQPFPGPPPFVAGMTGNYPAVPNPQQQQQQQPPQHQAPPQAPPQQGGTATRGQSTPSELTNAQQTVARRMAESKATAPEYFVETDVDMTNAVSYREQLRSAVSPAPSFNDFVIKACAQALRQYPKINGAYKDGHYEQYGDVNIGVVVSSDELLAVPTLFNVDQKGLAQIARESHELAGAVRNRTIQPSQLSGGTFSISNLGMYGVDRFTAILNPPQAAILAVGAINRKAVIAEDGMSLVVRQIMTVTLTCDHRILYGAEAAEFLGAIKAWLESPQLLPV